MDIDAQSPVMSSLSFPNDMVSKEAQDFIQKLLMVNPVHHMSLKDARNHRWITKHSGTVNM